MEDRINRRVESRMEGLIARCFVVKIDSHFRGNDKKTITVILTNAGDMELCLYIK